VDDILDGDGLAARLPVGDVRRLADDSAERARAQLEGIGANTSVLRGLVDAVADRTG
jgi:hypothetical protein